MRITAKVGGRIALDQTVTYLTFCSVENADRTAKALKVGEAFIEVSQGQREAITSEFQVYRLGKAERERAEWLASDAGKAETERVRKERDYDALHNEGAYGYNPHRGGDRPTYWPSEGARDRHYPEGA